MHWLPLLATIDVYYEAPHVEQAAMPLHYPIRTHSVLTWTGYF